jgi:Peptidase family C25
VTPNVQVDTGVEGYPNGSRGRGAPGNAGGGGTDGNPGGNDQNSGGGGGGNCGVGGRGGNSFSSNLPVGGFGGASLSANIGATRVFMGGGGGSGARNNSAGVQGSGAPGGGIVLVRAGVFRGIGTVSANGASADLNRPANDGGGGGGGGGTVILAAANASPAPAPQNAITVNVNGGAGSRSDQGGVPHGPGGGGGGGVALLTGTVRTTAVSATGGANGTTVNLTNPFGATSGANGACSVANLALTAIPGVSSGAQCAIASAVTLIDFQARKYSNGQVSVTWKTGYEVDNLGFNVYRESNGRRSRLTSEMVAGSALLVGAGTELTAGQGYAWRDIIGEKSEGVGYWLEAIDLKGESVWYGPFPAISASEPFPASVRNAPVLGWSNSRLGVERGDVAISPVRAAATNAAGVQRSAATALVDDPASAFQKQLAAGATVKLGVSVTGWQTVSLSALRAAGLSATANLNNLQLYVQGRQIPIRVTGSAIEFYGEAADTLQSGTQTYWLTEGTQTGLRISVPVRPRLGAPVPGGYPFVVERRDKTTYFAALLNGDEDNFFGSVVASAPVEQVVSVRDRETASTEPAELAVTLQGVTENIEHQVSVQVNGQPVGQILFEGRGQRTETFAVPAGQLRDGQNVVTLQGAGGNDVTLVGGVRLRYVRQYRAENDSLVFSATGGQTVRVAGFTQAARVVDVTNPTAPIEAFIRMEGTAATGLTATFLAPGAGVRKLVAFPATSVLSPSVAANRPSTWHQASNAADLAIITTRGLSDAVQALATARQNQGLRVAIVDVEDLYDEFNFGVKSSQAIKDFLRVAARQWSGPVRFALFVGDATFDPRNYLGLGDNDAVPTKLIETRRLETASDDWFGDFDDSGASEVAIGRLTARTADEAAAMTAKILAYEQSGGAAWRNEVLFVADNNDEGGDFEQAAALVQSELPPTMNASVAFLGQSDRESVRTQALAGIANGKALINYIGHGSSGNWAAENLLTSSDVQSMTGTGRSSVIVGMTCLNGFFQDVFTDCLAKALLRKPQGGAAAVWASSSLTEEPTQNLLNRAFVREAYGASGATTIGEAIRRAKLAIPDDDVRRSWTLLGDPSMPIR